jgi:glycosyltransferase involved in cell wall biosynthesis
MRILVVTSTFPRWQDDTEPSFVYELCRRLHCLGADIDVLAPHTQGAKTMEVMDGINVYRYRYCPERLEILAYNGGILANLNRGFLIIPFFLLFQGIAVWKRLRKEKYDLVHTHWIIPQGFTCVLVNVLSARRNRKPLVCTAHGGDLYALRGQPFTAIKDFVIDKLAHLCVVSRAMKETCMQGGAKPELISVLPMGVDLRLTFIPRANVTRRDRRLLFVGRFVEKKGIFYLIDAVAIIKKAIPDVELFLVGDGPLLPAIILKISQLGLDQNVTLTGSLGISRLPFIYSSAAVFVMPSVVARNGDQEGLGLVLVEAMGCGCAVVASDLPAIHDIVKHGQNGLLARPGDVVDLADKIMHMLKDRELRERVVENGREDVCKRFDWDETAARYYKLFSELAPQTNT